jgi:hypothetical protein
MKEGTMRKKINASNFSNLCYLILVSTIIHVVMHQASRADTFSIDILQSEHRKALKQIFESTVEIEDKQGVKAIFIGGGDVALVEYQVDSWDYAFRQGPEMSFKLSRAIGAERWRVLDIDRVSQDRKNIAFRDDFAMKAKLLSTICYFDFPITTFLSQPDVNILTTTKSSDIEPDGTVTVTWEWPTENQFGYFTFIPSLNWVVKEIGRTTDKTLGYLVIEHGFELNSRSVIPSYRKLIKRLTGKPEKVLEEDHFRVISSKPAERYRFSLEYYGISDETGTSGINYFRIGIFFLMILFTGVGIALYFRQSLRKRQ